MDIAVGRRDIRLFFEIVGQSLFDEADYGATIERSMEVRTGMMAGWIVAQGCPLDEAPATATLLIAELRGLMSDLLVTGDEERIAAAFELVLDNSRRRIADWKAAPPTRARNGALARLNRLLDRRAELVGALVGRARRRVRRTACQGRGRRTR